MDIVMNDYFDLVLFFSGIEHVKSPIKTIMEIHRILKPTGNLLASAPGDYPPHNDPIDNMIRLPTLNSWMNYMFGYFRIESFCLSDKENPPAKYRYSNQVFSTIIEAKPIIRLK
jgi:SAM-dependent methyltransferase